MKRSKSRGRRAIPLTDHSCEVWLLPGDRMRAFCRDTGFSETASDHHRRHMLRP